MAAREPSRYLTRVLPRAFAPSARSQAFLGRRNVSDEAPVRRLSDLETESSLMTAVSEDAAKSFDPIARSKSRKTQLPRSRYVIIKSRLDSLTRVTAKSYLHDKQA